MTVALLLGAWSTDALTTPNGDMHSQKWNSSSVGAPEMKSSLSFSLSLPEPPYGFTPNNSLSYFWLVGAEVKNKKK